MCHFDLINSILTRLLVVVAVVICSCEAPHPKSSMGDVSRSGWNEQIDLIYDNRDTVSFCDMRLALRLGHDFSAKKLPLHIVMVTPDSLRYEESVILNVDVEPWRRESKSIEITIPYRENVRLARMGLYGFSINPECEIVGVEAVGVTFENI